jgi:hypothetical protein
MPRDQERAGSSRIHATGSTSGRKSDHSHDGWWLLVIVLANFHRAEQRLPSWFLLLFFRVVQNVVRAMPAMSD